MESGFFIQLPGTPFGLSLRRQASLCSRSRDAVSRMKGGGAAPGSQSIGEEVIVMYFAALISLLSMCGVPTLMGPVSCSSSG